jgi:hypothetical protein
MSSVQIGTDLTRSLWVVVPGLGSFERLRALRLHANDRQLIRERIGLESIFHDLGLPPIIEFLEGVNHPDWLSPLAAQAIATYVHNLMTTRVLLDTYGLPELLIGYSLGEVVLATLSGICKVTDVLSWLTAVGTIIQKETSPATCYYVNKSYDFCPLGLAHSAAISVFLNGAESHLAACPEKNFPRVSAYFTSNQAICAPIGINYGFHTPLINSSFTSILSITPKLEAAYGAFQWYSCSRGKVVRTLSANDLWSVLREPFSLHALAEFKIDSPELLILEFGPICALSGFPEIFPVGPKVRFSRLLSYDKQTVDCSIESCLLAAIRS